MKKENIIALLIILGAYGLFAYSQTNPFISITYGDIVAYLSSFFTSAHLSAIGYTIVSCLKSCILAYGMALVLAIVISPFEMIQKVFQPIVTLFKSMPTISYILFALILLTRNQVTTVVVFLVLFPMCYSQNITLIQYNNQQYHQLLQAYPLPLLKRYYYHDFCNLRPSLLALFSSSFAFGFKVGIMAEIITSNGYGIGYQMNLCRFNMDMAGIVVWSIVIIAITLIMDLLLSRLNEYFAKKIL